MRMYLLALILPLMLGGCVGDQPPARMDEAAGVMPGRSVAPMLERVMPAVVSINVRAPQPAIAANPLLRELLGEPETELPQRPAEPREALGSGVIIDAERRYVVTNAHLLELPGQIMVTLNSGEILEARVVGVDADTDLGVLQLEKGGPALRSLPWGDSARLRVGDFVVAVGSPFGLSQTATSGMVSAVGRADLGVESYENFIQTDAPVNPGNSGGPLVNVDGQLIGINTAILATAGGSVGISFAIPESMVRPVVSQLIEHGSVRRGFLGIYAQDLTTELAEALGLERLKGALISGVRRGSPAARAGLAPGDLVVALDGEPVKGYGELRNRLGMKGVGEGARLEVQRGEASRTVDVVLGPPSLAPVVGVSLDPRLSGAIFELAAGEPRFTGDIRVGKVVEGSPAHELGLRRGDRILAINEQPVRDMDSLRRGLRQAGQVSIIAIDRGGAPMLVLVQ